MRENKIKGIIEDRIARLKKELGYKEVVRRIGCSGYYWEEPLLENTELVELKEKFNLLSKHLNLEYYKKEIKETNGKVKESVIEGFRKVGKK